MAYNQSVLYLASQTDIKLLFLEDTLANKEVREFSVSDLNPYSIKVGTYKIQGVFMSERQLMHKQLMSKIIQGRKTLKALAEQNKKKDQDYFVIFALETLDNQVNFNSLQLQSQGSSIQNEELKYQFIEEMEVVERVRPGQAWMPDQIT